MFDAKRLLGQFIADQVGRKLGGQVRHDGGFVPRSGGMGAQGGGLGGLVGAVTSNPALAGGLASLILGSKKGRKLGGSAMKLGGMALVGTLAYQAFQNWQAGQSGAGKPASGASTTGSFLGQAASNPWAGGEAARPGGQAAGAWPTPPEGSPFSPAGEREQQDLSRRLLRAMIAAAKSDGHIDAAEQAAIFGEIDRLDLDADDKAFVTDELRAPLDVDAVARSARNPEEAAEIYAASLLAIEVDNPAERGYLALLAARLGLDDALVAHLHATVEGATSRAAA